MRRHQAVTRRRRRLTLLILLVLSAGAVVAGGRFGILGSRGSSPSSVIISIPGKPPIKVSPQRAQRLARSADPLPLPSTRVERRGAARITYALQPLELRRQLAALDGRGGTIAAPEYAVSSVVAAPIFTQAYRNSCETAALSILLASAGIEQAQRRLQAEIASAAPLDPRSAPDGTVTWGDPNRGFVGRPNGGGPAGGFGVYPGPIIDLARRWAQPIDLTGQPASAIYRRLLQGRAVMAWVGLSSGPYRTWVTPSGRKITVNFGEHTVVLTGVVGNELSVNDPIDGRRKWWSKNQFEAMWGSLGGRAVSL